MEQKVSTDRAATVLGLKQPQSISAQGRDLLPSPVGPVSGEYRVIERRGIPDQRVTDDRGPGELDEVGAAVAVAEHPTDPAWPG